LAADAFPTKSSGASAVKYISPLLKWANKRGFIPIKIELERPVDPKPVKQRVLNQHELTALLRGLGDDPYHRAIRMLLLTAVRLTELTEATWKEFDLGAGLWTVPGARRKDTRGSKTRRHAPASDHVVPLPKQAIVLLKAIKAEAKRSGAGDKVFVGKQGGSLNNWDRALKKLAEETGVEDWSAHALRRTTSTAIGELNYAPHIVSAALGHKTLKQENGGGQIIVGSLVGKYNKSRYADEHRKALQDAADLFDQLAKSRK
jgi:integrase